MAFAFITSSTAGSTDTTAVTTAGVDTTGANLIVLAISIDGGVSYATPTDSKSNSWSQLTVYGGGANPKTNLWYCYAPTVGSGHTFSYSTVGSYPAIAMLAFSGSASSPFDVQNGAVGSGSPTFSPGSITPNVDNELVVASLTTNSTTASLTTDSGFSTPVYTNFTDAKNYLIGISYKIQTTAAAVNPIWTMSPVDKETAAIASFKSASTSATKVGSMLIMFK